MVQVRDVNKTLLLSLVCRCVCVCVLRTCMYFVGAFVLSVEYLEWCLWYLFCAHTHKWCVSSFIVALLTFATNSRNILPLCTSQSQKVH